MVKKDFGQNDLRLENSLFQKIIFVQNIFGQKVQKRHNVYLIIINYTYKRHYLAYSVAHYQNKRSCKKR